jgi:hypothetical protein
MHYRKVPARKRREKSYAVEAIGNEMDDRYHSSLSSL